MKGYGTMTIFDMTPAEAEAIKAWHAYWNWYDAYQQWLLAGGEELYGWMDGDDIARAPDGGPAEECLRLGHYLYWLWA